jgi:DNA helicase-2/ATP-dependent DNA helicase PcrA
MAGEGPMLVIAGAGSGKTRALTYRVSRLIEDGVDPSDILLAHLHQQSGARDAEPRRAARDDRHAAHLGRHVPLHRQPPAAQHAEADRLSIELLDLDDEDAKEMMESAVSSLGIKTLEKRFPKGDVLLDIYSFLINTRTPLELHLEQNYPHFGIYRDEIVNVFRRYKERKRKRTRWTSTTCCVNWKLLLDDHPEVAER